MKSAEEIRGLIATPGLAEAIREGAVHKVKLIQDLGPQMRDVKDCFLELMERADWKNGQTLAKRMKEDKSDEQAKVDVKVWKKQATALFKAALKALCPNEGQAPSVATLYAAGPVLEAIGRRDIIDSNPNCDPDQPLCFKPLEKAASFFASEAAREELIAVMLEAEHIQQDTHHESDAIKHDAFSMVPESLRHSKKNKKGIKESGFQKLVRTRAMRDIKDAKSYEKYVTQQLAASEDSIDREAVVLAKTKDI